MGAEEGLGLPLGGGEGADDMSAGQPPAEEAGDPGPDPGEAEASCRAREVVGNIGRLARLPSEEIDQILFPDVVRGTARSMARIGTAGIRAGAHAALGAGRELAEPVTSRRLGRSGKTRTG